MLLNIFFFVNIREYR